MTDDAPERARRARLSRGELAIEALGALGVAAVLYGVAQIYPPAAWILGGLALIGISVALPYVLAQRGED